MQPAEEVPEEGTLGERAEKARRAALPKATSYPTTDPDKTQDIEFEFEGEIHVIEIRAATYGRRQELLRGMKTVTWEEPFTDADGLERIRVKTERDDYAWSKLTNRVFEEWVLTIDGRSWNYSLPAMASLGDEAGKFLTAFGEAFLEEVGLEEVLAESRKKSGAL